VPVIVATIPEKNLPDTGGMSLYLVAGALLLGGGILLYVVLRRMM
jgi:LPXTG-motif cell wall-anchored protein